MRYQLFGPVEGIGFLTSRATCTSLFLGALCLSVWTGSGRSSQLDFTPVSTTEILLAQRAISDTNQAAPPGDATAEAATVAPPPTEVMKSKSQGKAFLYNLILPGAGHL